MSNICKFISRTLIFLSFLAATTACTPVADQDSAGMGGSPKSLNSSCKDQKRRLDQMVARGQANSKAYHKLLDSYWGNCA